MSCVASDHTLLHVHRARLGTNVFFKPTKVAQMLDSNIVRYSLHLHGHSQSAFKMFMNTRLHTCHVSVLMCCCRYMINCNCSKL